MTKHNLQFKLEITYSNTTHLILHIDTTLKDNSQNHINTNIHALPHDNAPTNLRRITSDAK